MPNDVLAVISWYVAVSLLGWTLTPLAWRMFPRFRDRGLSLSRPLGLLAVGYVVWLGGSLGVVSNSAVGILGVWLLLCGVSAWSLRGRWRQFRGWLAEHGRMLLLMEGLFLLAFAGWAYVRSFSPEIVGTEKPMELAFLNSVVAARGFPPPDPWLSGYGISYYYFGFVMMGVLTQVTSVAPGVAFNLTISMWFALTILAAYGVTLNLISASRSGAGLLSGLLGPLFVAVSGNLEGFLELLHSRGLFWSGTTEGGLSSAFWRWLDIKDLVLPPIDAAGWIPERNWWWWRASRVVRDVNLTGADVEVIDEFPFFSFLLADNHPHVLALPFVLLAVAFALHVLLGGERRLKSLSALHQAPFFRPLLVAGSAVVALLLLGGRWAGLAARGEPLTAAVWAGEIIAPVVLVLGGLLLLTAMLSGAVRSALGLGQLLLAAWIFGSLAFLNAWDFPIYLALLGLVLAWVLRSRGWRGALVGAGTTSLAVLIAGVLLFLPWYPSFASQAGGILPNLIYPTKLQHFLVMFGTLFVPIVVWLVLRLRAPDARPSWKLLLGVAVGLPLALFGFSWLLAGVIALVLEPNQIGNIVAGLGASNWDQAARAALERRAARFLTALVLGFTAACSLTMLLGREGKEDRSVREEDQVTAAVWPFVAMLVGLGSLIILAPEFVYLRDSFGTRMNTVFKFYYAGWILWGLAAAFAAYQIWPRSGGWRTSLRALALLPLLLGMVYPIMGILSRTGGFSSQRTQTLDGTVHLQAGRPDDKAAIEWINRNLEGGVIAEAVGGSYSEYARIATHTHLTTVLGWEFHEVQWRGSVEPQGSRRADIERLYTTGDWREARDIVRRYNIDYVYVGSLERSSYGSIRNGKFEAFMNLVYQQGPVSIYAAPQETVSQ